MTDNDQSLPMQHDPEPRQLPPLYRGDVSVPEPERRRSLWRTLGRPVSAFVRPAIVALDVESIKRCWSWAQDQRRFALGQRPSRGIYLVGRPDGGVDPAASAASIRAFVQEEHAAGRASDELFETLGHLSPDQVEGLTGWQNDQARFRIRFFAVMAVLSIIVAFYSLAVVRIPGVAIMAGITFLLLAAYFGLSIVLEIRENKRRNGEDL